MRQLIESHCGLLGETGSQFNGLTVTLRLDGGPEEVREFNKLSAADRVREASRMLKESGAKDVATPTWAHPAARAAAFDAAASQNERELLALYNATPIRIADAAPARNTRATRLHRTLDVVMDRMEARGRRPTRDCQRDDDDQVVADTARNWPGQLPIEDATLPLRRDAAQSWNDGNRQMGTVPDEYGRRMCGRAADAGRDDWAWILGGAGGAAASTGGVL
jgi:hypothetical protein